MFIVLKKKTVIALVLALVLVATAIGVTFAVVKDADAPNGPVVVLDAGHGGVDKGAVGINSKVSEKELNLIFVLAVKERLEQDGVKVVLTRADDKGLYGDAKSNLKKADMAKRKEIILAAKPALVVSVHGNKYPDKTRRGAQVFFDERSEEGKRLAALLQSSLNVLNKEKLNREFSALKGDYYILKCSEYPSAIVEYGFLSNADDDALLQDENYRNQLVLAIYTAINGFLSNAS